MSASETMITEAAQALYREETNQDISGDARPTWGSLGLGQESYRELAAAAIDAAEPLIREQIANEGGVVAEPCECGQIAESRVAKGIHYGYPTCCIEFYVERSALYDAGIPVPEGPWKLDGSGFIPCLTHNHFSKVKLIGLIELRRECSIPFTPNPQFAFASLPPCDCYPHGPQEPCTCTGCRYCPGHKYGCTCDINWACTESEPCPERARNQMINDRAHLIHDHIHTESKE